MQGCLKTEAAFFLLFNEPLVKANPVNNHLKYVNTGFQRFDVNY